MGEMIKADEYEQMERVARALGGSSYCTQKTAADALWVIATGRSLGLDPVTALRGIHVIKGKPVLSADLMAGAALRHPDCVRFQVVEMSAKGATVEVLRKGWDEPSRYSFTLEDAKTAGLTGNPTWRKFPADMCKARAIARAARAAFPDAILGVYVSGELDDELEQSSRGPMATRTPQRAEAEVIDVEVVEDREPRVWSDDPEWKRLNRAIRASLKPCGKADAEKYLNWAKERVGVESLTHIPPTRLAKILEHLGSLGDNDAIVEHVRSVIPREEMAP
jgi:hypothetical protein